MKVSDLSALNRPMQTLPGVERREGGGRQQNFRGHMAGIDQSNAFEKLNSMNEAIAKQGAVVARRCDMLELKKYREMVIEYMNEAVRFTFEFKKQSTLDARGRHRMYAIIKRINKRLEELTKEMLAGQADNLAVMNAIDEIRGMLLDLLL
ncbi:MAG: YaaR family protein [Oscillospiraceae bacterium]|nr:YaaR family protein [Oscillospiraceae bacterium]